MKRLLTYFILLLSATLIAHAGSTSAATRLLLCGNSAHRAQSATDQWIQVFLEADEAGMQRLRAAGAKIGVRVGGIATASIPLMKLNEMTGLAGVHSIAVAQPMQLCNDSALLMSNALPAIEKYSGQDVVIGMIDCGFDFNHINFRDSTGRNRIELAYLPADTTGHHPIVNGDTLPGSIYSTPSQIAALTTDDRSSIHATHTTGTAAGSCTANGLAGLARGARIVACGMPESELTDANIANSLAVIFDYAKRFGLPCVVNMSLGDFSGPHDGTSYLCRLIDSLSGPGKFCVLSAGNDGNDKVCLSSNLAAADTLSTMLWNRYGGTNLSAYLSLWSDDATPHKLRFVVASRSTGKVYYTSPWATDSTFTLSSDADAAFSKFFPGQVQLANAVEDNGRFHTVVSIQAHHLIDDAVLGWQCVAQAPTRVRAWCNSYTRFTSFGQPGWQEGTTEMTISDLCTGDSAIAVGAYNTRINPVMASGKVHNLGVGEVGDISNYSSFGPDVRGIARPEILAPGSILISSYNRYDTIMAVSPQWRTSYVVDFYPYGINSGTSMSAPVVSGAIALFLQARPNLTVKELREALRATARNDAYTAAQPLRSGYGKLDVNAALQYLLNIDKLGDVNDNGVINVNDVTDLINLILSGIATPAQMARADLNSDAQLNVNDVTELINKIIHR